MRTLIKSNLAAPQQGSHRQISNGAGGDIISKRVHKRYSRMARKDETYACAIKEDPKGDSISRIFRGAAVQRFFHSPPNPPLTKFFTADLNALSGALPAGKNEW
jgi:hypothetical protein